MNDSHPSAQPAGGEEASWPPPDTQWSPPPPAETAEPEQASWPPPADEPDPAGGHPDARGEGQFAVHAPYGYPSLPAPAPWPASPDAPTQQWAAPNYDEQAQHSQAQYPPAAQYEQPQYAPPPYEQPQYEQQSQYPPAQYEQPQYAPAPYEQPQYEQQSQYPPALYSQEQYPPVQWQAPQPRQWESPRWQNYLPTYPTRVDVPAGGQAETITCPECGAVQVISVNRRDAEDFCTNCDYPLFWTPSTIRYDRGELGDQSLRRLPGTVGRATLASVACPHCSEPNTVQAVVCVRCGLPMHAVAPPVPVYMPPPLPPPVYVEPKTGVAWWVWLLIALTFVATVVLIVLVLTNKIG